ncbi:uncharacterized protein LOC124451044 [Xenia sp. Carnegie-2017]|uniref:uncharacterized protein LOC124451044 n=1 Tax=Xenia sp. Carnegie-2017 TaxID=2897299 RepID=UPI001F03724A|nr:uncharacterized protein LOC124451044 [Xenia sp. Carnegie-2017]
MLEEIIGFSLSIFSLFVTETPRVSLSAQHEQEDASTDGNIHFRLMENDSRSRFINKEYDQSDLNDESEIFMADGNQLETYCNNMQNSRNFKSSLWKSLSTSINLTFATILPTLFALTLVYIDTNTTYSCLAWRNYKNKTLPLSVKRVHVFGDCVESFVLYLWFPLSMMMLFGWKEFKEKFTSALYVCVIFGEMVVIYHLISFQFNFYDIHSYYRIPPSILFCVSLFCSGFVILYNIRACDQQVTYSNCHIIALLLMEFIFCAFISYANRYELIPAFNGFRKELYKFLVALTSPALTIIPAILCKHMALRRSDEIVHPGRSFILVYVIRGAAIFIFRTMQSDFKSISLFIGLSLFSAVLNFLKKATQQICYNVWKRIITKLQGLGCFQRLQILPWNTAPARLLKADLEIQDILFEYNTLVLSQAYLIFYQLESFKIDVRPLLLEFVKRISIGLGIDFIFNCLSNFVQMHYFNIPIGRVWKKYWKRHLLANIVVTLNIIAYYSLDFNSVFKAHFHEMREDSVKYPIRNCSLF